MRSKPGITYRSYFGEQVLSQKQSFPEWGFGTSKSDALLPLQPSAAPGPGTYNQQLPPASANAPNKAYLPWGKMPPPPDANAPAFLAVPGPTKYTTCTAHMVGQDLPAANLHNAPRYSWTRTSTRESRTAMYVSRGHEREAYGSASPGPHTVGREAFQSCGIQTSSTKLSSPRFAAPRAQRFMRLKACDPSLTPGPGSYNI